MMNQPLTRPAANPLTARAALAALATLACLALGPTTAAAQTTNAYKIALTGVRIVDGRQVSFTESTTSNKRFYIAPSEQNETLRLSFTVNPNGINLTDYELSFSDVGRTVVEGNMSDSARSLDVSISRLITVLTTDTTTTTDDDDDDDDDDDSAMTLATGMLQPTDVDSTRDSTLDATRTAIWAAEVDDTVGAGSDTGLGANTTGDDVIPVDDDNDVFGGIGSADDDDATDTSTDTSSDTDGGDTADTDADTDDDTEDTITVITTGDDDDDDDDDDDAADSICGIAFPPPDPGGVFPSEASGSRTLKLSITSETTQITGGFGGTTTQEQTDDDSVTLVFDGTAPNAPRDLLAQQGENKLILSWIPPSNEDEDGLDYEIYVYPIESDTCENAVYLKTTGTSARVEGLENNRTYRVEIRAVDQAGNVGEFSSPVEGTPVIVYDYWERYRELGGDEDGGFFCATTASKTPRSTPLSVALSALWLAAIALVSRLSRLSRLFVATALTALATFTTPHAAHAGEPEPEAVGSPRNFAFELRFSPVEMNEIDSALANGATPFADIYGTDYRLMIEAEFDWYAWQEYGVIALGLSFGGTRFGGPGLIPNADGTTTPADEDTTFWTFPIHLSLIYRYDELAKMNIPIVPYVKVGPTAQFWWVQNGSGDTATFNGDDGQGAKYGLHVRPGIMFLLDFIDPGSAASFDLSTGINNSYIFAEFNYTWVNNFGQSGLDLSMRYFTFGLALEF